MKNCKHCNVELSDNHKGLQCKTCKNGLDRYDLNRLDMIALHESQGGKCKLCSKPIEMFSNKKGGYIDHCHSTGEVRGVLCHPCNTALGYIENNLDINDITIYLSRQFNWIEYESSKLGVAGSSPARDTKIM